MDEGAIRLTIFALLFVGFALAEALIPWRSADRRRRWGRNLLLAALGMLLGRLVFAAGATGVALWADARGWGLFPLLDCPAWAAVPLTVMLLDFLIYWQHRLFHRIPLLWRIHRVHHTDLTLDLTTALRFHPVEIVLSLFIKAAAVILLGAPALGVLAFEILLSSTAIFNHANFRLPSRAEALLRRAIVTPGFHRVHHSIHREETDSNFGFCLTWWDIGLQTYRRESRDGEGRMTIGLPEVREDQQVRASDLLLMPFRR